MLRAAHEKCCAAATGLPHRWRTAAGRVRRGVNTKKMALAHARGRVHVNVVRARRTLLRASRVAAACDARHADAHKAGASATSPASRPRGRGRASALSEPAPAATAARRLAPGATREAAARRAARAARRSLNTRNAGHTMLSRAAAPTSSSLSTSPPPPQSPPSRRRRRCCRRCRCQASSTSSTLHGQHFVGL
jgi:hypothetical protein